MCWFLLMTLLQWKIMAPMPTPRYGFGIGVVDDKIYVIGGCDDERIFRRVEVYDPKSDSWKTLPESLWLDTARCFVGSVVFDSEIYIIGGLLNFTGRTTGLVQKFNPHSDEWHTVDSLNEPRSGLVAVEFGATYILAIGGYNEKSRNYSATVETYDPDSNLWFETTPHSVLNTPRLFPGVARSGGGGNTTVVGGCYYNSLNTVEYLYDSLNIYWWGFEEDSMRQKRHGLGVARTNVPEYDYIWAIGGYYDGYFLHTVELFNPTDRVWEYGPSLNYARAYLGVATLYNDNVIYVIGGKDWYGAMNTVEKYPPTAFIEEKARKEAPLLPALPAIVKKGTRLNLTEGVELKLYNAIGALIKKSNNSIVFDQPAGVYFLRSQKNGIVLTTQKIIVIQ